MSRCGSPCPEAQDDTSWKWLLAWPRRGVRAVGVAARHSAGEPTPEEVGLTIPVLNSALPRRLLYAAWDRLSMPRVDRMLGVGSGGGAQVVHATTWAIPPTSCPLVVTVHDVAFLRDSPATFTSHGAAYFNRALDITKHRADAVIVPSEATARDCIEAGIDEELITVIPHGLTHTPVTDSQVEDFRARHGLTRPYILWVGTREPRKNLPTLLRAYRAMASSTDLDLVLVGPAGWGEDPEWGDLPAERTHVLGRLDDTDLACAYAGARVFTFPSIWEASGCPSSKPWRTAPPSLPAPTPAWRRSQASTRVSSCRPPTLVPSPTPWRPPPEASMTA